jgi:hypothetical protein
MYPLILSTVIWVRSFLGRTQKKELYHKLKNSVPPVLIWLKKMNLILIDEEVRKKIIWFILGMFNFIR